jgi:L-ascorbate metabolism protein UlaG (beta-lactamase superfamily)
MIISYLGTNCLLIRSSSGRILVDPFFSRPGIFSIALTRIKPDERKIDQAIQEFDLADLEAIILTHTHYDHALDAPEIARRTGARLVGGLSMKILGHKSGLPASQIMEISPQQMIQCGDLSLGFYRNSHLRFPGVIDRIAGARDEIKEGIILPAHALAYRAGIVHSILIDNRTSSY